MTDLQANAFDFGIRIVELAGWLKGEGKEFPLINRLLECGTGLGISLRAANGLNIKDSSIKALRLADEAQYLLELMVKTSFLTELQSKPLLSDCLALKEEIGRLKALPSAYRLTGNGKSTRKP